MAISRRSPGGDLPLEQGRVRGMSAVPERKLGTLLTWRAIGFIGLGNMGLPMAAQPACKAGHAVSAFDLVASALDAAVAAGARAAARRPRWRRRPRS